ncbi:MAG: thiamine pyrophosphate-requiring protein [Rhodospirillaceae bacterium]|nr:thiamine pyrophosphate-requiring protein [Rhodospirillaceae bacterium]MBT4941338.1 thiamine pyrophosphate-requiring protein [Rhodospirillaceae bacterium]MBT7266435.1 thiamine pyrophosphate-requiring protein [Rhodospirillaceae bacterium]
MDKAVEARGDQKTVAEVFLSALSDNGVEYVFANGGTDFAPIIEALVSASQAGEKIPQFITVPHENVAMAMAEGYYRLSGKPAGVMVHVTVGTANTICGVMNASRDNVPILVMAGRTPLTESGDIGSRNIGIHWGQENFDQGGMLREYVKWDYELRESQPVEKVVNRALDIAMSEPCGPVYLTLPREVLGHAAKEERIKPKARALGNAPAVPSNEIVDQAAELIAQAKNPLIISGGVGQRPGAAEVLGEMAEKFAIPIVQVGGPSLLTAHPMNMGFAVGKFLPDADLVLVVESAVPWLPRNVQPDANAKLVHLSPDPQYTGFPYRGFEMDVAISGEPVQSLKLILEALAARSDLDAEEIKSRGEKFAAIHDEQEAAKAKTLADAANHTPILAPWVAACLNKVKADDSIIVSELGVNVGHVDYKVPSSIVSGGQAGGLGHGLGSALGAKLAAPDRDVILLVGDGSYMFGGPTPAHFVGKAQDLPTLTIVMNNSKWFAVDRATRVMYPDGKAAKANEMPLTDLTPSPNYEKIMEACGGYGELVDDPAKLEESMRSALEKVRGGTSVLLNVITSPGGRD